MTLPSTGTLSMSQINTELSRPATQTISLNEAAVRGLAGVSSGAIGFSSLRGKAAWTPYLNPPNVSDSGSTSIKNFTISCLGAPAGSTYSWTFGDVREGAWSVQSGQGTSTVSIRVSGVVDLDTFTTVICTVTNSGVTKTASGLWEYSSYGITP